MSLCYLSLIQAVLLSIYLTLKLCHSQSSINKTQAQILWNKSLQSYDTTSYVYQLDKYCDNCNQCDIESKYIIIQNNIITEVKYSDSSSQCLQTSPIYAYEYYSYHTIDGWFTQFSSDEYNQYQVQYNNEYGYPQSISESSINLGFSSSNPNQQESITYYDILCLSFIDNTNEITLNYRDQTSCMQYNPDSDNNDDIDGNDDTEMEQYDPYEQQLMEMEQMGDSQNQGMDTNMTDGCKTEIIEKDDCTEWYYVYMTTGLSIVLSTLSIVCFWLYYIKGINPATKGYKRSRSYDGVINDSDESDDDDSNRGQLEREMKRKKAKARKKKMSKLLGIDENKQIPKVKIRSKKNKAGKYGSVAQTDEDEKTDGSAFDNPFDMDDSERSDDWHFIADDNNGHQNGNIHNAGSASDQTDEEEED